MTHVKLHIALLAILFASILTVTNVSAQESAPQTTQELVTQRCQLAQNYIKDIQKPRDLRARVDRLQAYRYIYQRLDVFTKRLERNKQPEADNLRASLDDISKNIEQFKVNYEQYDAARESLTKVQNCRSNITSFQSKLETARNKRQAVNESIVSIEAILSPTVKGQLETLYQGLLATGKTGEINE